jgi:hypothetical protein
MAYSAMQWQSTTIANASNVSAAINLGRIYDFIQLDIPAVNACSLSLLASSIVGGTYNTLGASSPAVNVGTGSFEEVFRIGGHQFIKVLSSVIQNATRTFNYRGLAE